MAGLSTEFRQRVNQAQVLLFPPCCLFCQQPLARGEACCAECLDAIGVWPRHACRQCGRPLAEALAPGPCGQCLQYSPDQQQSHALFIYRGPVRQAILAWKLQGRSEAVRWLLAAAQPRLRLLLQPTDLLLPVPMPLSRMRKSGQHHAADLCRWLATVNGCAWDWRLLRRIGEQPRQSELAGAARRRNLRKAFAVDADYSAETAVGHGRIWVVDDIQTTGATLRAVTRALRPLHAEVGVLTLARTMFGG